MINTTSLHTQVFTHNLTTLASSVCLFFPISFDAYESRVACVLQIWNFSICVSKFHDGWLSWFARAPGIMMSILFLGYIKTLIKSIIWLSFHESH